MAAFVCGSWTKRPGVFRSASSFLTSIRRPANGGPLTLLALLALLAFRVDTVCTELLVMYKTPFPSRYTRISALAVSILPKNPRITRKRVKEILAMVRLIDPQHR